jgi:hypothetical protein
MNQVDLGAGVLVALVLLSATSTLGALAVFRRFTDSARIGRTASRIVAHLMELGLFFDEPALVLRAQGDLFRENLKLLRLIALPCALLALPFAIFFTGLNAIFGRAPLAVGAPAVVTLQWRGSSPAAELEAPQGIEVETPPVRITFSQEVSWRIRPIQNAAGWLKLALPGSVSAQKIFAGSGLVYAFPFPPAPFQIPYPSATILHMNWILWYILVSAVTALAWSLF